MKKYFVVSTMLILISLSVFSQEHSVSNEYPGSIVDVSAGVGQSHGTIGVKSVLGYKGTGLMLAVGSFDGFTTTAIGFQVAVDWWFASLSYGATGSYEVAFGGQVDKGLTQSFVFLTGGRINLIKSKRLYLELAAGLAGSDEIPAPFGQVQEIEGGLSLGFGLGYRFGNF